MLSDRAFCVLVYMAKEARDEDNPPVYWGGWKKLATEALGKRLPERTPEMTSEDFEAATRKAWKSYEEIVRRAVADLLKAGAIRYRARGRPGVNAEYELMTKPVAGNRQGP